MNIQELKSACNTFYDKAILLLEKDGEINSIRRSLLNSASLLVQIGTVSVVDKVKCEDKARNLLALARELISVSAYDSVYFKLVGRERKPVKADNLLDDFDSFVKSAPLQAKAAPQPQAPQAKAAPQPQAPQAKAAPQPQAPQAKAAPQPQAPQAVGVNDSVRPQNLENYFGQDKVKEQLTEAIVAAKLRREPLEHILLFGSAGLGKTTLSKIIANEMGSNLIVMSAPSIKDVNSFIQVIKTVKYADILFIDEIHRIPTAAAEAIYTVMEDFELSYIQNKSKGVSENVTLHLPRFTIIGATTHSGLLEKPMRDRFGLQLKLEQYSVETMCQIVQNSSRKLGLEMTEDAILAIAKRSRGVPRIANSYIKRVRDKAQVKNCHTITEDLVRQFFEQNSIDDNGLLSGDIAYLKALRDIFDCKPTGLDSISSAIGEGKNIIENQYEPYLIYLGLIQVTTLGRALTEKGKRYLIDPTQDIAEEGGNIAESAENIVDDSEDGNIPESIVDETVESIDESIAESIDENISESIEDEGSGEDKE